MDAVLQVSFHVHGLPSVLDYEWLRPYQLTVARLLGTVSASIWIGITNGLLSQVARLLNDREMHRTETEYEDAYVVKVCIFQFINSFIPLFYVAFVKAMGLTLSLREAGHQIAAAIAEHWSGISLRPPQLEAIAALLAGRDVLVTLRTGFGKSLCFQAPAMMADVPGVVIVLTPLLALCQDQVQDLESRGVAVARLTSDVDPDKRGRLEEDLLEEEPSTRLLYVTPEGLQRPRTREIVSTLHTRGLLRAFAIDEAHMVSEW